jgi:hypothetical protein
MILTLKKLKSMAKEYKGTFVARLCRRVLKLEARNKVLMRFVRNHRCEK